MRILNTIAALMAALGIGPRQRAIQKLQTSNTISRTEGLVIELRPDLAPNHVAQSSSCRGPDFTTGSSFIG